MQVFLCLVIDLSVNRIEFHEGEHYLNHPICESIDVGVFRNSSWWSAVPCFCVSAMNYVGLDTLFS